MVVIVICQYNEPCYGYTQHGNEGISRCQLKTCQAQGLPRHKKTP